jgi:hypothetical protein
VKIIFLDGFRENRWGINDKIIDLKLKVLMFERNEQSMFQGSNTRDRVEDSSLPDEPISCQHERLRRSGKRLYLVIKS